MQLDDSWPVLDYPTEWERSRPASEWGHHAVLLVGYNRVKSGPKRGG